MVTCQSQWIITSQQVPLYLHATHPQCSSWAWRQCEYDTDHNQCTLLTTKLHSWALVSAAVSLTSIFCAMNNRPSPHDAEQHRGRRAAPITHPRSRIWTSCVHLRTWYPSTAPHLEPAARCSPAAEMERCRAFKRIAPVSGSLVVLVWGSVHLRCRAKPLPSPRCFRPMLWQAAMPCAAFQQISGSEYF